MLAQVFRWLIIAALLAAVLIAVFVAWWLALLIALAALAIGVLRRLFGSKPDERTAGGSVVLEGEYTEVERDASRNPPDRNGPAS